MANLVELYDLVIQAQALNGVPLSHGHVYVYALGRTKLMDTWSDIDGESLNTNPVILDNAGQAHIYVSDDFDYTLVFTDEFDNEIFSVDKYLLSKGEHSHADVAVAPSEHIGVSSYHVGEVTVYVPYLTGEVGKVYEGIDPIVVNNDVNRISANHIPLGVQDPLYFVEDSETACIIGFSGQTVPEGVMTESALGFENDKITGYNGSAFSAGNEYEAGSYVDINNNTISVTGLQPEGDYAYNSALSSKLDVTATGQFLTGLPEDLVYSADITGLATTAQLDEKLDKSDSGNFYPMEGNPSGFLTAHQSLQGYATEQWVEDKSYLTSVDIPESATWNATTQTVSANSAQWAGGTANPQIPVTSTSGISIFESGDKVYFNISADYALADDLTGKQDSLTFGYKDTAISSIDNSALYDNSAHARITTLAGRISDLSSNKLDTTAFSDVSGTFLTAHQDLSDYQTTAGMTAYQEAGDYYSASNPSGFITGVDLTPYQLTADMTAYMTTADSANFYTTANESGFISEVPAGTMNESEFEYSDGMITAYNGSAFKAGDEFPESATEAIQVVTGHSADWDGTTETVSANSADWGGSILNLSSRDGIDLELDDNTLYIGASAITASITSKQDKLTFDYNANNAISAINGSAVAAGTDLEFEYDAADNISAINSSAISTTPAQALYAQNPLYFSATGTSSYMGINIDTLKRALGIDETVLADNISVSATGFTLSEKASNFETIKIYGTYGNFTILQGRDDRLSWTCDFCNTGSNNRLNRCYTVSSTDGIHWNEVKVFGFNQTAFTGNLYLNGGTDWWLETQKIVGIGRKEV